MKRASSSSNSSISSNESNSKKQNTEAAAEFTEFRPGDTVRVKSAFVVKYKYFHQRFVPREIRMTKGAILKIVVVDAGCFWLRLAGYNNTSSGLFLCGREEVRQHLEPIEEDESPPLTLLGSAPYPELVTALETSEINFPRDLARKVASFLVVKKVAKKDIAVVDCSSQQGNLPLETRNILAVDPNQIQNQNRNENNNDAGGWASSEGTMKDLVGEEWLEFELSPTSQMRRCTSVGISIRPRPWSVWQFRIDASQDNGISWQEGTDVYETMHLNNQKNLQEFRLGGGGIDANRVRLVCLKNNLAQAVEVSGIRNFRLGTPHLHDWIGLFRARWE